MEAMREEEEEFTFETSHVLGAHLVSSPLLPRARNLCMLADSGAGITVEVADGVVYVAFSGTQMISSMASDTSSLFTTVPIGAFGADGLFPALARSDDDQEPVLVHGWSLQQFVSMYHTPNFQTMASGFQEKAVVLTGHSFGGSLASLTTLYFLCASCRQNSPPASLICITFGSPILGNEALSVAVRRHRWADKFCHVVAQSDPVPRLFFCPPNIWPTQEVIADLRRYLAMHVGNITGGDRWSCTYCPFGSYLLCSAEGAVCVDDDSMATARLLYLTFISSSRTWSSCGDYGDLLASIRHNFLKKIDAQRMLSSSNHYRVGIQQAIRALGIGFQDTRVMEAEECLKLSKRTWSNPNLNCAELAVKLAKVNPCRAQIEWYKTFCDGEMGYYDAFKHRNASKRDHHVNINRIKLAQFWDQVVAMLQHNKLPCDFHRRRKWVNASQFYMTLVEPLDIAEYYKTGTHKTKGHYVSHGRETRYEIFDRWWKDMNKRRSSEAKRSKFAGLTQDSCFWAKVEEATEWLEEAKNGKEDGAELAKLCEKLINFERYSTRIIENWEISVDVIAPRSSYTLWSAEWSRLKLKFGIQIQT